MQGPHILNEISFLFCMKTIPYLFSYISVMYGQLNLHSNNSTTKDFSLIKWLNIKALFSKYVY